MCYIVPATEKLKQVAIGLRGSDGDRGSIGGAGNWTSSVCAAQRMCCPAYVLPRGVVAS